ncbi:MAG: co-chaperone GroES family protein [Candidatus Hodgkinia cicadicola]
MLTRLVIDGITYYVKVNSVLAAEGKLIDGTLWIGKFSVNAVRNFKSLLLVPYDVGELVCYRLRLGIDYYTFVKVSMANIMRTRRLAVLKLMSMVLSKQFLNSSISNLKLASTTRKLLWSGRISVSSLCRSDRFQLLKLNKAIKFCEFAFNTNCQFSKTNDPFKLFRINQLISSLAYYLKISPETLFFNLKLSCPKNFNKSNVNISEIKRLYHQTLVLKSFRRLGSTKLQLLRHNWLLTLRRLRNMRNLNINQFEIFIPNLNFWTMFYRTLLMSSTFPFAALKSEGLLEWRNNLMLNLNFINYALSFYRFSAERSPIIPFALVILNKIKSFKFLFNTSNLQTEVTPALSPVNSIVPLPSMVIKAKLKLKPLFNRVIIIPDNTIKISVGGIILPETSTDTISIGTISETSDGLFVKTGDKVLYNRNAALKYSLNGNIIDILDVVELLAIVSND